MKTLYSILLSSLLVVGLTAKDRSRNESTTPTMTEKAISAGFNHTLVMQEGQVFAWGENTYGQLGDGTLSPTGIQVPALNLDHIIAVSAGRRHSMALRADGAVFVWGDNTYGQLGTGGPASSIPVQLTAVSDIIDIQAGDFHCLALKSDGTIISWGANTNGELGQGTISASAGPGNVINPTGSGNLSGITLISAGARHSLAILDGNVLAWGDNSNTQLGRFSAMANSSIPIYIETGKFFSIKNLENIIALSAGETHSMATDVEGQLWTWGEGVYGQLGVGPVDLSNPATYRKRRATKVASKVRTMAAGNTHSIYVDGTGELHFFGANFLGQLGISPIASRIFSDSTVNFDRVVALACGADFTILLRSDGSVMGAGDNAHEQLGPIPGPPSTPVFTNFFNKVDRIAQVANQSNSYVLKSDGTVWSFGHKDYVGFTTSTHVSTPTQIPGLNDIIALGAANKTVFVVDVSGQVRVWGNNSAGVCGLGTTTPSYTTPTLISSLSEIVYVEGSIQSNTNDHVSAIQADGTLYMWGYNNSLELADGTLTTRRAPIISSSPGKVFATSLCSQNSFGLYANNTIQVWGSATFSGSSSSSMAPSPINSSLKFKSISTSRGMKMGLTTTGIILIWGRTSNSPNFFDITNKSSYPYPWELTPSLIFESTSSLSLVTNVKSIESSDDSGFYIKADGSVWAWGNNKSAELGRGYASSEESIPARVSCIESGFSEALYSSISVEHHVLGNKAGLEIESWGADMYGEVGLGTISGRPFYYTGCNSALRINVIKENVVKPTLTSLSIYPNPATSEINIHLGEGIEEGFGYQLIDTSGRSLRTGRGTKGHSNIKIQDIQPGIYFLKIQGTDFSKTQRVIIQ